MSVNRRATAHGYRYDVRLRSTGGAHIKRTFRTRREADRFHHGQLTDAARGVWIDPRDAERTLAAVAAEWLGRDVAKRSSTMARDETTLRVHVLPTLAEHRLRAIRPPDVQALVNAWSARSKPRTVRRQYGVLRAVLGYAVGCDYIARTPCRGIKLPEVAPLERPQMTVEQVASLAGALGPNYGQMVYLGAVLGLRWGECAGLRVGRVDFLRGTITVAEQLTRGARGVVGFGQPKSAAGARTLAVPEALVEMLAALLARRGLTAGEPDALLFSAPEGGPLRYEHWRRRLWVPASLVAGAEGLTFHDLRRANATGLIAEGVDIRTAQARLGHSDPRLTLAIYAQATSAADRAAADALGSRFLGTVSEARAINAP